MGAEEPSQSSVILTTTKVTEKVEEKTELLEETKAFSVLKEETQIPEKEPIVEEKLPAEEKAGLVEVLKAFIKEEDQNKCSENSKNEEPVEYLSNDSDMGSMGSDDDSISDTDIIIPTSDEKPEKQKFEEKEIETKES